MMGTNQDEPEPVPTSEEEVVARLRTEWLVEFADFMATRRRSPRGTHRTPTPLPFDVNSNDGGGTPAPRKDETSWPSSAALATQDEQGAAQTPEPELSPERIAELEARSARRVDRALAKPARS